MFLRQLFTFFCIFALFACSSSGGRAPVSDLTLGSSHSIKAVPKKGTITGKSYTVQKGDTLYSIGWRSGLSVSEIADNNSLSEPYLIKVGQRLALVKTKTPSPKKSNRNSDPSSKSTQKTNTFTCEAQNCLKNKPKGVEQEKPKAYSRNQNDKEKANKDKENIKSVSSDVIANEKVSDWSWPVKGKLTKFFSASESGKQGISIVNRPGSAIFATAPGEVVYAGSGLRGYGNLIIIKHNNDYLSAYAHNESLLVTEKAWVKKGQKIATMGDTGSDHVHLHFEIRYRGKSVDPLRYLPKR